MENHSQIAATSAASIRILLIGDATLREGGLARNLDTQFGARAVREVDGWAALATACARDENYEVAILRHPLGWSSAQVVVRKLKAQHPDRPIIMLVPTGGREAAVDAMHEGLDDYVAVPDDYARLPRVIEACLARAAHGERVRRQALVDRERSEAALRASEERARLLVRLSDTTRSLEEPDEIAGFGMRLLRDALHADRCAYGELEDDGAHYRFTAVATAPGVSPIERRRRLSALGTEGERSMRIGRPFVIHDIEAERAATGAYRDEDAAGWRAQGVRGLIAVPVHSGNLLASAVCVHSLTPRRWTQGEVELAELVAERVSESIERARVSSVLRDSEAEFRGLFESSAAGAAEANPITGRFLRVNRRFCEITGYSETELHELTFTDITHPDDRDANAATIGPVVAGESERWEIEKRYMRSDGMTVWVHISGHLVRDAHGHPYRLIANAVDVSDRKRAEQALVAGRRQLQMIADGAPVMLASCTPDYRFKFVNKAYAERFDCTPDDIVGLTVSEVLGEKAFAEIKQHADRALEGRRAEFEIEMHYRDLGPQWIRSAYAPECDESGRVVGWLAAALDITDRKEAEEALRSSEQRYRRLVEQTVVGVANADFDGVLTFVNDGLCELLGYAESELTGRNVLELMHPDDSRRDEAMFRRLRDGAPFTIEKRLLRKEGTPVWVHIYATALTDSLGRPQSAVAIVADISERKRAEQALQEADRRKDEFLAVLGHELRNPLAPLSSGLELIRRAGTGPEVIDGVRSMMERQLEHLVRLVDDLLDVSRFSRGKIELQRAPLDLAGVIEAAVELVKPQIGERRHVLVVERDERPLPVEGDFQRLIQVVGNLLSNAAKYTEPEGTISVRTEVEGRDALVRVADTGFGIPPERLPGLFQMFSQVPEHRSRTGGGGLGIGLSLSRQLVELHGGSIEARSAGLGEGSEFVIRLPLAAPAAAPKPVEQPQASPASGDRGRVLIVDDNVDAAAILAKLLELKGHAVRAVNDGPAALHVMDSFAPRIVLLDIGLPEMDGYEVARRIRARPEGREILLIAVTGWGQHEDKQRAACAGFDHHVTKPVDLRSLERLMCSTPAAAAR
ncbi:MAG TPA: PAS domain S-box protein [Gammaproteobacteria bacterium]|nr:PAS domain S-box protein [Gammaproteobacteria bacterium]